MRKPDAVEMRTYKGIEVSVSMWTDPTDYDCDANVEGWDLLCVVSLVRDGIKFSGTDSLAACWGDTKYITACFLTELYPAAIKDMECNIAIAATDASILVAQHRQQVAVSLIGMNTEDSQVDPKYREKV